MLDALGSDLEPYGSAATRDPELSLFRLLDPEVLANPYPLFARLRTEDPVHWDPFLHAWVVTRYADVITVLRDFSAARAPSTFRGGAGTVQRLFPDYAAVEREYYARTRIFPIMHVMVIRREVYEQNRWVAQSLYRALVLAQKQAYADLRDMAALKVMLPFLPAHVEEAEKLMGGDFWPYGLEPNEHTLSTFLRYSFEQGLSKRQLAPKELFAPESLESFKI